MAEEKLTFQTEVSRLLHIVANSLYSEKQIFLRELISNASDACDRLRYEAITNPNLTGDDPEFRVCIAIDKKARTIEIAEDLLDPGYARLFFRMEHIPAFAGQCLAAKLAVAGYTPDMCTDIMSGQQFLRPKRL